MNLVQVVARGYDTVSYQVIEIEVMVGQGLFDCRLDGPTEAILHTTSRMTHKTTKTKSTWQTKLHQLMRHPHSLWKLSWNR